MILLLQNISTPATIYFINSLASLCCSLIPNYL